MYRSNQEKLTDVLRALADDPGQSNRAIAAACGVGETCVRRIRAALEASAFLAHTPIRVGLDGRKRGVPERATA